jgi:hypothetical protein
MGELVKDDADRIDSTSVEGKAKGSIVSDGERLEEKQIRGGDGGSLRLETDGEVRRVQTMGREGGREGSEDGDEIGFGSVGLERGLELGVAGKEAKTGSQLREGEVKRSGEIREEVIGLVNPLDEADDVVLSRLLAQEGLRIRR